MSTSQPVTSQRVPALALLALGVVFGDVGTSPLYALRECFRHYQGLALTDDNVLGVLSLIFWALIIVISIEYTAVILRADNRGEGGILALTTLATTHVAAADRARSPLVLLGLVGAALLSADAMITPAISVLSAVEGLSAVTPFLEPAVLPLALGVLVGLYLFQHHGTTRIGAVFGPIVLVWFTVLGVLGMISLVQTPEVLAAVNPWHAAQFFVENTWLAFAVMGSVFLVVTGGEALYADMGHFGRTPIRLAWYFVALPGLVLNYFGQGALLLRNPGTLDHLFYELAPPWAQFPLIALATAATVIASQAVISGAFSISSQAINLGFCPRLTIHQTSARAIGQIYVPAINALLMVGTLSLVLIFQESGALAAAYGVAVSTTMLATTLFIYVVARRVWRLSQLVSILIAVPFLCVDFTFWSSNLLKLDDGGWMPVLVAAVICTFMITWKQGRELLREKLEQEALDVDEFVKGVAASHPLRVSGTAVFLTSDQRGIPRTLLHNLKHNQVLHETVILLTVEIERVPYVEPDRRVYVEPLGEGVFRAVVHYGFHEQPDLPEALENADCGYFQCDPMATTFFLGRVTLLVRPASNPKMAKWRRELFAFMSRNAVSAANYFRIPPNRVVELGAQFEL